jgi:hypothetical protein
MEHETRRTAEKQYFRRFLNLVRNNNKHGKGQLVNHESGVEEVKLHIFVGTFLGNIISNLSGGRR